MSAPGPNESAPQPAASGQPVEAARMPPVWRGRRRGLLISLVLLGILQAVFALLMALSVGSILSAPVARWDILALLVLSVLGIGLARWMERIVAEQLGQDYVFEQRRRLISSAISGERGNRSLGVIVTRASNDLTAIRNWIAQGIVPLATGLPLILVIVGVLTVIDWRVAAAVSIPLGLTALSIPRLAQVAFDRARTLRRHRGRMSGHIADTVRAGESILIAGAVSRELNAVDRNSSRVVDAAVDRARITGFIRALTITAASLCTVAVVLLSMLGVLDAAGVASVMTLLGIISTPLGDLGRVVEYRQNYKAARRILAPVLTEAIQIQTAERRRARAWNDGAVEAHAEHEGLRVRGLTASGAPVPDLDAVPGDRVRMVSEHPDRARAVLQSLLLPLPPGAEQQEREEHPFVLIDGLDFTQAPQKERRKLVGFASRDVAIEQGSIRRLITYRHPQSSDREVHAVVDRVGLRPAVQRSRQGMKTRLKNGAVEWPVSDRIRLTLARALLGQPPVLVLENISVGLDEAGRAVIGEILTAYPGVVLFTTTRADALLSGYRVWDLDGDTPEQRQATRDALDSQHTTASAAPLDDAADDE